MTINNNKISFGEKVGYSLGDVAANLVFQMMMIYQLKFYTDIFGLDGTVAGTVLLIAPIIGAFADPVVGLLTDRTHTRWGKYRPWLLWTALPFCAFYVLAFYNPGIENKTLVAVYATVSYVLLLSMYSFNNTPYASLGGVMTSNIKQRTSINSVRFIASSIAQFVVQGLTLPLVNKFGAGNEAHGWTLTISLFALLAFVCCIITFLSTRERISPPPHQQLSMKADVKQTFVSVPWRAIFMLTLFLYITLAMWGSSMNFYFQNYVDQHSLYNFLDSIGLVSNPDGNTGVWSSVLSAFNLLAHDEHDAYAIGFSLFNMVNALVQFLGVILLPGYLANKFGKKKTFIIGLSLTTVFTAMFYLPGVDDIKTLFVLCILKSLAYAPTIPLLWAMIADVADYIEYVNHRRATGFCFSGVVCALKVGLGLGGAFAGLILSAFGYVSGGVEFQSESAINGIRIVSSIIPAVMFGFGIVALCFYPITKKFNENMQAELASRRAQQQ
jgi:GPH family glycoside/pentoside/hexuronide:cation symporter